jgi:hypothetical protein
MNSPALTLRPGDQLASATCSTRVIVVRAPATGLPVITCGGSPMVSASTATSAPAGTGEPTTLIGKRYVDQADTLELLCIFSGAGALECDGVPMTLKAAKVLPASD